MPYRLFRRVRIAPGVSLNLSKRGASVSLGGRGAHYTIGHGRRRTTVGVPGTGMSWTTYSHRHARAAGRPPRGRSATPAPSSSATIAELFQAPPGRKIGYGLVFTLLVITSPIGIPLLLTGLVQLFSPVWRQRSLIQRALAPRSTPAEAAGLLDRAAQMHAPTPELLAARAELSFRQAAWPDAARLYYAYLGAAPDDLLGRTHYAHACLMAGWYDQAIAAFEQVLAAPVALGDDERAEIARSLAVAFLGKGDREQALAVVRAQPLQRHSLSPSLAACLQLRAECALSLIHI